MIKKCEEREGVPFSQYIGERSKIVDKTLKTAADNSENALELEISMTIYTTLQSLVNADICITHPQKSYIETLLNETRTKALKGENIYTLITPIATFINSLRLDCDNCLNDECEPTHSIRPCVNCIANIKSGTFIT